MQPGANRRLQNPEATVTRFTAGSSEFTPSSIETYLQQAGVCRGCAHLKIARCQAPERPGALMFRDRIGYRSHFGPTDFQASVKNIISGTWYIFDPSGVAIPMGFVRIGAGRDAADISVSPASAPSNPIAPMLATEALKDQRKAACCPGAARKPYSATHRMVFLKRWYRLVSNAHLAWQVVFVWKPLCPAPLAAEHYVSSLCHSR